MTSAAHAVALEGALTPAASRALGAALGDGAAVAALRARGARALALAPMPSPATDRPWKYVDAASLDLDGLAAPSVPGETPAGDPLAPGSLALRDGGVAARGAIPAGLTLAAFAEVGEDALAGLGEAIAPDAAGRLTALHYAFLRGGVVARTAPDAEIAAPVRITRHFTGDGALAAPHTLIAAGPNSRLAVVEEYRSDGGELAVAPAVEILAGPGSVVRYAAIHRWGPRTRVFAEQRAVTQRDAALVSLSFVTGGRLVKGGIASTLAGRGSSSELYGLAVGGGGEQVDFHTLQDHVAPDTRSDLLFKSALGGRSRGVYYGVTRVGLGARRADAHQENRTLLLSRAARADSDPVLEILTNDVLRVSHGATAGPVDDEELFYIQSRGMTRAEAVGLLVRGFLGEPLDRGAPEALREELGALVDAKLRAPGAEA